MPQKTFWVRNLETETLSPVEGKVTGTIPNWLQGSLIRNGAGVIKIGISTMNNLFDGLAVLHRFSIKDGKATYQNRILTSESYLRSKEANRLVITQFGTRSTSDPCQTLLGKFMSRFTVFDMDDMPDNCNVSVGYFGDTLYAMTETAYIYKIDPETLETVGDRLNLYKYLAVTQATAHPHIDEDGMVYNMGNSVGPKGPMYHIIEFDPKKGEKGKGRIVTSIPARWKTRPSYYHSFAMTENYFVFAEMPLGMNIFKLLSAGFRQVSIDSAMEWSPKDTVMWIIIDRKTGQVLSRKYESSSFICFHHGNAYEKDGHIVVDTCLIPDGGKLFELIKFEELVKQRGDFPPSFYTRFVIPLNPPPPEKSRGENLVTLQGSLCSAEWKGDSIFCVPQRLVTEIVELPRINYNFNCKNYRYVYGVSQEEGSGEITMLIKIDLEKKLTKIWGKEGFSPSEPIFVESPNAKSEDDGVILFSALNEFDETQVMLIILDAKTFEEMAVIEFQAAGVTPKDFHGQFLQFGRQIQRY